MANTIDFWYVQKSFVIQYCVAIISSESKKLHLPLRMLICMFVHCIKEIFSQTLLTNFSALVLVCPKCWGDCV